MKRLARYKVYLDRARNYIAYVNFLMIGVIFVEQIGIDVRWWMYIVVAVLTIAISLVIGYLDKKYIRKHEQGEMGDTNPYLVEILKEVKKDKLLIK